MRFWRLGRMSQIFVAILAGVCSKETGHHLWLWSDLQILVMIADFLGQLPCNREYRFESLEIAVISAALLTLTHYH